LHLLKNIISFRFPPFRILGTPKPKIFPHFFKFCARRFFFLKGIGKFSGFGRKLLQSLRAESGAEGKPFSKVFSEKNSSLIIKTAPDGKLRLRKRQCPLFLRLKAGVFVLESPVHLNEVQSSALVEQPIFCIFAYGETSKFSE